MKTVSITLLAATVGVFALMHAQPASLPAMGPMGSGMMGAMHQQLVGLTHRMGGMMQ